MQFCQFFWLRVAELFLPQASLMKGLTMSLLFKQVLIFNRLTWKKNMFSACQVTQVEKLGVDWRRSYSFYQDRPSSRQVFTHLDIVAWNNVILADINGRF